MQPPFHLILNFLYLKLLLLLLFIFLNYLIYKNILKNIHYYIFKHPSQILLDIYLSPVLQETLKYLPLAYI